MPQSIDNIWTDGSSKCLKKLTNMLETVLCASPIQQLHEWYQSQIMDTSMNKLLWNLQLTHMKNFMNMTAI